MPRTVCVTAASRLHLGMLSFGQPGVRAFGGVGVMIDRPGVRLTIAESERFETSGPLAARVEAFVQKFCTALNIEIPRCHLKLEAAAREHVGLGVGTSLGLAVASGLQAFLELPLRPVAELAQLIGRATRSSVGLHGFEHGGLIAEAGAFEPGQIGPLIAWVELPEPWRFLLIAPPAGQGLSGAAERAAFVQLPPVPTELSNELAAELVLHLLPAAREGDFERFSASVFRYGHAAGMCFAPHQGGPYANAAIEKLVHLLRDLGIEGVGQSSWGPLLFALLPNQRRTEEVVGCLRKNDLTRDLEFTIAAVCNHGAQIRMLLH